MCLHSKDLPNLGDVVLLLNTLPARLSLGLRGGQSSQRVASWPHGLAADCSATSGCGSNSDGGRRQAAVLACSLGGGRRAGGQAAGSPTGDMALVLETNRARHQRQCSWLPGMHTSPLVCLGLPAVSASAAPHASLRSRWPRLHSSREGLGRAPLSTAMFPGLQ